MIRFFLCFFILFIVACENQSTEKTKNHSLGTGNPTVEEVLKQNENADIFIYNDIVYKNASSIDWVMDLHINVGEKILTISTQTSEGKEFQSGTATKLPIGTKIYKPSDEGEGILIAVVDGKEVRYLGLIEG